MSASALLQPSRRGLARLFPAVSAALASVAAGVQTSLGASAQPLPMARGYVAGPYGLVHYRDTGKGQPLVMFHQSPMSSRQFEAVYPLLAARRFRAIGIDTPGFGNSDPTPFAPKVEDWAKVLPPVLDHLGLDKVDVLGHHTGSTIATEVSLQYPGRVLNLIIHGAYILSAEEKAQRLAAGGKDPEFKLDGTHLTDVFASRVRMYGAGADPRVITRYVVERFTGAGPTWYGANAAYTYDQTAALMRVKHRTQLIGNTGDLIYDLTLRARNLRPDFTYVELQGGGVDITDQQPAAWVDAIQKFLRA